MSNKSKEISSNYTKENNLTPVSGQIDAGYTSIFRIDLNNKYVHIMGRRMIYIIAALLLINCSGNKKRSGSLSSPVSSLKLVCIDSLINDYITQKKIPGAVALIAKDGKITYHKAFGYVDLENMRVQKAAIPMDL